MQLGSNDEVFVLVEWGGKEKKTPRRRLRRQSGPAEPCQNERGGEDRINALKNRSSDKK